VVRTPWSSMAFFWYFDMEESFVHVYMCAYTRRAPPRGCINAAWQCSGAHVNTFFSEMYNVWHAFVQYVECFYAVRIGTPCVRDNVLKMHACMCIYTHSVCSIHIHTHVCIYTNTYIMHACMYSYVNVRVHSVTYAYCCSILLCKCEYIHFVNVYLHICMHFRTHTYVSKYTCECISTYMHAFLYTCICKWIHLCMYIYIFTYISTHIHMRAHTTCECISTYLHAFSYTYICE
jgi:hypothetical protein